jgi:hypothetical protein
MEPSDRSKWNLVTSYDIDSYRCGLRAGDHVELKKALVVRDHAGLPTGLVHPAGEVWDVLPGSNDDPGIVWLRQPDGNRHAWVDDPAEIDEWFRRS